jgi:hypothetical protein
MKAFYCGGLSSGYSSPIQFTTATECPPMHALSVSTFNNNPSKARFSWDTTGVYVFARVKYRIDTIGSTWGNVGGFGIYYPTFSINTFNLESSMSYRAHGRLFCDSSITAYRSPSWTNPPIYWTQPGSPIKFAGGTVFKTLEIFPNPSNGIFNLSFYSNEIDDYIISIKNILGQELSSIALKNVVGEVNKIINIENFSPSAYIIELSNNNYSITKNIIIR